jgi:hypothetical protein
MSSACHRAVTTKELYARDVPIPMREGAFAVAAAMRCRWIFPLSFLKRVPAPGRGAVGIFPCTAVVGLTDDSARAPARSRPTHATPSSLASGEPVAPGCWQCIGRCRRWLLALGVGSRSAVAERSDGGRRSPETPQYAVSDAFPRHGPSSPWSPPAALPGRARAGCRTRVEGRPAPVRRHLRVLDRERTRSPPWPSRADPATGPWPSDPGLRCAIFGVRARPVG